MELDDAYYFVHVVEQGGFAPAGRRLDVPKSRLSRHVRQLEDRLGVRLLQRTSRRFRVTDEGRTYYGHARAAVDALGAGRAALERRKGELLGTVRLSCSAGMAQFALIGPLTAFLSTHPGVTVVQHLSADAVDLVAEGIDLAVRAHAGPLPDSTLIRRSLARAPWHLFAAPALLDQAGAPEDPADLGGLPGLQLGTRAESGVWSLRGPEGASASLPFRPRLVSEDMGTLKAAAARGLGVLALPAYVCRSELATGRLLRVLPDWTASDSTISLVMPSRHGVAPATQALADHLRETLPAVVDPHTA